MMKKKNNKKVYVAFAADILHEGHINILKIASSYGHVIVGLLTDSAIAQYKKLPHLTYKQREVVLKNIKYVDELMPQNTLDYTENLKKIKPDFVVHGDDWKTGALKKTREKVVSTIKKWSGKLIEPAYTKNISSKMIKKKIIVAIDSYNRREALLILNKLDSYYISLCKEVFNRYFFFYRPTNCF